MPGNPSWEELLRSLRPGELITPGWLSRQTGLTEEESQLQLAEWVRRGWLEGIFPGQFRLTPWGRLQLARENEVTLLARPGCHLCEQARAVLQPWAERHRLVFFEVDVDTDRHLRARFGSDVPVAFMGNREIARHRVRQEDLRRQLPPRGQGKSSRLRVILVNWLSGFSRKRRRRWAEPSEPADPSDFGRTHGRQSIGTGDRSQVMGPTGSA